MRRTPKKYRAWIETLKAARVNAAMTQDQVAQKMHKNKQTIVNWESGITDISFSDVLALCELYHVPIEYIKDPKKDSHN